MIDQLFKKNFEKLYNFWANKLFVKAKNKIVKANFIFAKTFLGLFVIFIPFDVIQTTEGRKNLGSTKWMLLRFFANAQNDKMFKLSFAPKFGQNL